MAPQQDAQPQGARREIDTSVPHIARVYDYWLGGTSNYESDRQAAVRAAEANPVILHGVHGNRAFLARAVRYLAAEAGIRQFLDIGSGIPDKGNTHQVAQVVAPQARVVYVDNDPVVLDAADRLLAGSPHGVAYLDADARDVATIISQASRTLDFSQPVAVLLIAVLHCLPDEDDPWGVVARLAGAAAAGSYVALTHPSFDWDPGRAAAGVSRLNAVLAQRLTYRPREQVLPFFDGLELVPPGLVRAPQWRPQSDADAANPAGMWGGVAAKP
ncbi:MAG TPA: SAM-dependent methyltransferase [Trebonia sp.]|nr:SAM-dependent methyltransferase [Trebonia sp.]